MTRALAFVPIYVLGFSSAAIYAYLVFVSFQAILIHANLRVNFGPAGADLRDAAVPSLAPQRSRGGGGQNFAVHLPVIDRLFGTYYLPRDAGRRPMASRGTRCPRDTCASSCTRSAAGADGTRGG